MKGRYRTDGFLRSGSKRDNKGGLKSEGLAHSRIPLTVRMVTVPLKVKLVEEEGRIDVKLEAD